MNRPLPVCSGQPYIHLVKSTGHHPPDGDLGLDVPLWMVTLDFVQKTAGLVPAVFFCESVPRLTRRLDSRGRPWFRPMTEIQTALSPSSTAPSSIRRPCRSSRSKPTCRSLADDDEAGRPGAASTAIPATRPTPRSTTCPGASRSSSRWCASSTPMSAAFAKALEFDLGGQKLTLDDIWVNVLPPGGVHTSHIHPRSVISGTFYVAIPPGSSAHQVRGSAARADDGGAATQGQGPAEQQSLRLRGAERRHAPALGELAAPRGAANRAESDRISVSFNYSWR